MDVDCAASVGNLFHYLAALMGRKACAPVAVCEDLQVCFSGAVPSQSCTVNPSQVQSFAFFSAGLLKFPVDPFLQAMWESCQEHIV